MPEKYTSNEKKVSILAWGQEKVPVKVICELSGRGNFTILKLLADAKDLSSTEVPKNKFRRGRRKMKSQHANAIMKRATKIFLTNR